MLSIGSQGFILPTGVSQMEVEQTSDKFIAAVVKKSKKKTTFWRKESLFTIKEEMSPF